MQEHDIESLRQLRAVYTDRIDRFRSPEAERSFREYAAAVTSSQPRDDVRIQSSRRSEQAERYTDMILEWERRIDEKCGELEKIVSRIDQAIREHEKYLTYSKALRFIFALQNPLTIFGESGLSFNNKPDPRPDSSKMRCPVWLPKFRERDCTTVQFCTDA